MVGLGRTSRAALSALALLAVACQRPDEDRAEQTLSSAEVQERLIEQNRAALEQERQFIREFIDSTGWAFAPAGSGAHEWRVETGQGSAVVDKELVRIRYRLTGLRGEPFAAGDQEIRVLRDPEAVWGLQYALQRARHGDSVVLVLPAHLGHGLAGQGEIPPLSPLVYYLRVL